MTTMTNIFETAEFNIMSSPSSIFSKDDVLKLINGIQLNLSECVPEEPKITEVTELMFQELNSNVKSRLYQYFNNSDLVDYDSAEFEIEYNNQLVLNNVHVDLDSWADEFDDIMLEEFQSTFGNPIK
jgi:hypothetical protein